ncbi:hypothetical protein QZH41_004045 [Actinostola sp. cb2023]|nr:hypothetical protein QZH41_004045 [Actinostola sp. cb2023]
MAGIWGSIEALQFLLQRDFKPNRGIYFAYGHDEEVHGIDGAKEIAKVLRSRKVQLEFIIDEGTVIVEGVFPGVDIPYAL